MNLESVNPSGAVKKNGENVHFLFLSRFLLFFFHIGVSL
jgi:hypothetical protein